MTEGAPEHFNNLNDKIEIRAFFERILLERDRTEKERDLRYDQRFVAQETATTVALSANKEATATAFASAEKAGEKALTASDKLLEAHNGLLHKMELQSETFATKDEVARLANWQARLTGAILIVAAIEPILLRLWIRG